MGLLGDGTTVNRSIPVQILGLTDVIAISAGNYDTVALKADGTVWAWGENTSGQLGIGTRDWDSHPVPAQVLGLTGVTAIVMGSSHTLAIRADRTLWAWGYNGSGQLGDGTTKEQWSPKQVPGMTDIVSIAAQSEHSFAVKSDGTLWGWGNNGRGQLGDGTDTRRLSPVYILSDVSFVVTGQRHTMAIKQRTVTQ